MKAQLLLIPLFISFSMSQIFFDSQRAPEDRAALKPPIYYSVLNYFSPEQSKSYVNFALFIQNDVLQFNKSNRGFTAGYEVSLNFRLKETKKTVIEKIWQETVEEKEFTATNSRLKYNTTMIDIDITDLSAQEYLIYLEVKDINSGKEFRRQIEETFSALPDQNEHTKIHLVAKNRLSSLEIPLSDEKSAIDLNTTFRSYFEWAVKSTDSVKVQSKIYVHRDGKEKLLQDKVYSYPNPSDIFIFNEPFPVSLTTEGEYKWRYLISCGKQEIKLKKTFSIIWFNKPYSLLNLATAVEPMMYILPDSEWTSVKKLQGTELRDWFRAYWRKRDENPVTPLNEVMNQFYLRVDRANLMYQLENKDGWKTDRGKSFILYGEPDKIERQKNPVNTVPFEIWIYNRLNQKLTFVDARRDNRFKLVSIEEIKDTKDE